MAKNKGISIGSSPIGSEGFAHPSARTRRSVDHGGSPTDETVYPGR